MHTVITEYAKKKSDYAKEGGPRRSWNCLVMVTGWNALIRNSVYPGLFGIDAIGLEIVKFPISIMKWQKLQKCSVE